MKTVKEPVKLRQRKMPSGNTSLYLDIYYNGKRQYEYLKLYLVPETNRQTREKNRETLRLAEAIRSKRLLEVINGRFGFEIRSRQETPIIEYCEQLIEHKNISHARRESWQQMLKHLREYCNPSDTFQKADKAWCEGFKKYLDTVPSGRGRRHTFAPLAQNTKNYYFSLLKSLFLTAMKDGIILKNPILGVESYRQEETVREYLTLEEVRKLSATPCTNDNLRRAFLFSCLTGLRRSDILKITWGDVRSQGVFVRIIFRQTKTKGQEYMDISPEAVQFLGERQADEKLVFEGFVVSGYMDRLLKRWVAQAGIAKHITFHSGRHTFAVLMLELGADVYTLQKLLGHREIATTQVYAHMLDKRKQDAVARIPHLTEREEEV